MLLRARAFPVTISLLVLLLCLCNLLILAPVPAIADVASAEIAAFDISTRDGTYTKGEPLVVGVNYEIRFTIDVATGVNDTIILQTDLQRSGDRYWELLNENYSGIDLGSWTPGQPNISFNATPGTAAFVLTGTVPEEYTTTELENAEALHRSGSIMMLNLSLQSGGDLEGKSIEVIDSSILTYRDALSSRQGLLNKTETVPEYAGLVGKMISQAENQAESGYTERATALLQAIPVIDWPEMVEEGSGSSNVVLYVILAILAVIAVAVIVLMLRSRSTASFLKQRVDDQANKLDIVEARVQKLGEKSLTGEISQIRDTLRAMARR
jgi:hypothetical protein